MHRRVFLSGAACLATAGCSVKEIYASDEDIARYSYRHNGPKRITLYTMISTETGAGAHSSMMLNASQRVVFDPAGSVTHPRMPERRDVLYGFSPRIADVYARAHARNTYYVVIQELDISAAMAESIFDQIREIGPVQPAQCALSISSVLREQEGLEALPRTWFPKTLMSAFAEIPGVTERTLREADDDDKAIALAQLDIEIQDISKEAAAGAAAEDASGQLINLVRPVAR